MTATAVAAALAVGLAALLRARRTDARRIAAYRHRVRTADQVMDDARRWRANRRKHEAREDHATCEAIYALPTIPRQRKETGQ
ncbi:hypothetical protein ACGFMM_01595 [Streptomyces sp. NPDC048604]|uniref:hypothetical protein n=1 Tax=Streptomyces sp. NPDC048604 TaxID=3365578 RepID=UPI00371AB4F0